MTGSTTPWKASLVTAALVVATIGLQEVLTNGFATFFGLSLAINGSTSVFDFDHNLGGYVASFGMPFADDLLFGAGVFLSLRFVSGVTASRPWIAVILAGLIASAMGAAVFAVLSFLRSALTAFGAGPHPLGYSFQPDFNDSRFAEGTYNSVVQGFTQLVGWVPLVVLACVLLKLWLVEAAKARASDAGTP